VLYLFYKEMLMKLFYICLFISLLPALILPQHSGRKFHAYSGTLVLTAEGGITLAYTDYKGNEIDYLGKGSIEYFFPTNSMGLFGIRAFAAGGFINQQDDRKNPDYFRTKMTIIGLGGVYKLSIGNSVFPYGFAGASYLWFNPRGRNDERLINNRVGKYKKEEININGEIGLRILIAENLSFNLSGALHVSPNDNLDDIKAGLKTDLFYTIAGGFSYSFFTKRDSDGDGVPDDIDICPDTPGGLAVDEFGCPVDSDMDGVPDYLDKCPGTPRNVKVDNDGCPVDSDNDGVPDYRDLCPGTPKGVRVDEFGCPVDSDNDGVPDYLDKCPNTPPGVQVDASGCPKDSDGDGVPDFMDECPNTPSGVEVDERGCAKVSKQIIMKGDANFEFGTAKLLPSSYSVLNNLALTMKDNLKTRWRIEGYTDAIGSDAYNLELSRKRAEAVANYLTNLGIDRNRLEILPMGKSKPVATNETPEGRAMNRRVEIKLIE
jgi:OOP family OmpA-OmpF porin